MRVSKVWFGGGCVPGFCGRDAATSGAGGGSARAANASVAPQARPAAIMQTQRIAVIEGDLAIWKSGSEAYTALGFYGKALPEIAATVPPISPRFLNTTLNNTE
jgi:hypothetical protein